MPICDGRIAGVLLSRRQFAGSALQKQSERLWELLLDNLPHGASIVRRDETVAPCQRGRMAGIVDKNSDGTAFAVRDPADQHCCVGFNVRSVSGQPALGGGVGQIAICSQTAATLRPLQRSALCGGERLLDSALALRSDVIEIRRYEMTARLFAISAADRWACMGMGQMDHQPVRRQTGVPQKRLAKRYLVLIAAPPSEVQAKHY